MSETLLDPRTALVVVDLQKGIVNLATVHPVQSVVDNAARLAAAFRRAGLPVVLVNVAFAADGGDWFTPRSDVPFPSVSRPVDFAEIVAELNAQPTDIRITKHQWGAFYGTELDLQLRRRGITGIVLTGISTSIGVDSTARGANERAYNITFANDAMTDANVDSHRHSLERIFPRIGQVRTTAEILDAVASLTSS